jgi:pyruvate dehydrogenase E1 component alpha subunit/2-oxoisovalerate dehydrogenase E1 component alpha subunit
LVYVGDGATSTGAFHEGINFAAVQRCPLVVVVENNGYAYSTPTRKQTLAAQFVDKAIGYGIAAEQADGNDVIATYAATKRASDRARRGDGVTLVELITYRRRATPSTTTSPTCLQARSNAGNGRTTRSRDTSRCSAAKAWTAKRSTRHRRPRRERDRRGDRCRERSGTPDALDALVGGLRGSPGGAAAVVPRGGRAESWTSTSVRRGGAPTTSPARGAD